MPNGPDVRKRQFLDCADWIEGATKNPKAMSLVEDRQLELLQTGRIGDDVHLDANRAPGEKAIAPLAQVFAPRTSVDPPGATADASTRTSPPDTFAAPCTRRRARLAFVHGHILWPRSVISMTNVNQPA